MGDPWLKLGADDTCVVLLGHGSRDPAANEEHERVAQAVRTRHPQWRVETAYIELARPLLAEALQAAAIGARRVIVAPLLLFAAGHVKNDVPLALAAARGRFPNVSFSAARALGVHPSLVDLAWDRAASVAPDDPAGRAKTLLLVVGRGASDPDANGDFFKLARLIGERRGLMHMEATFLGIAQPRVETSLELVARLGPERLIALPYVLYAGRLLANLAQELDRFASRHPWIKTALAPHLGADERLLAVVDERVRQVLEGEAPLPCDTCQYRTAMPGLEGQVGGLRALLYSVRHTMTHGQAAMPLHAHRPLKKHVFVCCNADCADRGSLGVLESMRQSVQQSGLARQIRVTRTSCMGRCGEGPTVAVYPDGVFYRGVGLRDAAEIVHEHLLEDRLVARLVDDILQ
ncbi:MAG: CbiX/SirB N-terminal domain-containing protein [Polyangiaceae bacterium]|jgi:sirohydrochlorin ferrochelatase/(2Fe-2S) ferredoxin